MRQAIFPRFNRPTPVNSQLAQAFAGLPDSKCKSLAFRGLAFEGYETAEEIMAASDGTLLSRCIGMGKKTLQWTRQYFPSTACEEPDTIEEDVY